MAIPEETLRSWTAQGSIQASSAAYNSIETAIAASDALRDKRIEVYLQGSYKNHTNTRGDSDVDVVVQSDRTFFYELALVDPAQAERMRASFQPAEYTWDVFRRDVLSALGDYYGSGQVANRDKCITVQNPGTNGISADVVPTFTNRLYAPNTTVVPGIAFLTRTQRIKIVNFPRQHYDQGVAKQARANDNYKATVRMFKNARAQAVQRGILEDDLVPSYFVECMVFNAPDGSFAGSTWEDVFVSVYNSVNDVNWDEFTTANGIIPLFGAAPNQWNQNDAATLWLALNTLWNST